jgi:hypothetical protein
MVRQEIKIVDKPISAIVFRELPAEAMRTDRSATMPIFWDYQQDTVPIKVSLSVVDWPHAGQYVDVICRSAEPGRPLSCACAPSITTAERAGACRVPVRGGKAHFVLFWMESQAQSPIPLRVAASLLRADDRVLARAELILKKRLGTK